MKQIGLDKYRNHSSPVFEDISIKDIIEIEGGVPATLNNDHSISLVIEYFGINVGSKDIEGFIKPKILKQFNSLLTESQGTKVTFNFVKFFGKDDEVEIPKEALIHEKERMKLYNKNIQDKNVKKERFFACVNIFPEKTNDISQVRLAIINTKMFLGGKISDEDNAILTRSALSDIDKRVVSVKRIMDKLKDVLNECGVSYKAPVTKQDLFNIILNFTLPRDYGNISVNYDEYESTRAQIFNSEKVSRSHKGFFLNGYFHRVYSMDKLPRENVYFGQLEDKLLTMGYEFYYSLSVCALSKKETDKVFASTLRRKRIDDIRWGQNKKRQIKETQEIEKEEDIAIEQGTELSRGSAILVVKIPEWQIEEKCREARISFERYVDDLDAELKSKKFDQFGGSSWQAEDYGHFLFYSKTLIGSSTLFSDDALVFETKQTDIPFLIPLRSLARRDLRRNGVSFYYSESEANGTPGGTIAFDHFDKSLQAPNCEIFGGTGSGKSVLIQSLLTAFMSKRFDGADVIIRGTDIGGATGSYEKITEIYGGEVWKFKGKQKPNINILKEINPEKARPKEYFLKKVSKKIHKLLLDHDIEITESETKNLCRDMYSEMSERDNDDLASNRGLREIIFDLVDGKYKKEIDVSDELIEEIKLRPGNCLPESDDLNFILSLMDIFLTPGANPGGGFGDGSIDIDFVSDAILRCYELKNDDFPDISDFRDMLIDLQGEDSEDSLLSYMIRSLSNWTREGKYPFFDLPTNVNLESSIIIADLNDLIKNETIDKIGAAYVAVINKIFMEDLYAKFNHARMFLGDENWKVAKSSKMLRDFQEGIKRLARKYGFFNVNATQGGLDYAPFPSFLKAVKNNTFTYFVAGVVPSEIDELCSFYGWGEDIREKLREEVKLKETDDGKGGKRVSFGRAIMINQKKGGQESVLIDNILTPIELEIYHTDADTSRIHAFYKSRKKMNLTERIDFMREKKHLFDNELIDYLSKSGQDKLVTSILEERRIEENKGDD